MKYTILANFEQAKAGIQSGRASSSVKHLKSTEKFNEKCKKGPDGKIACNHFKIGTPVFEKADFAIA